MGRFIHICPICHPNPPAVWHEPPVREPRRACPQPLPYGLRGFPLHSQRASRGPPICEPRGMRLPLHRTRDAAFPSPRTPHLRAHKSGATPGVTPPGRAVCRPLRARCAARLVERVLRLRERSHLGHDLLQLLHEVRCDHTRLHRARRYAAHARDALGAV